MRTHNIKASEMFEPVIIELWDGSKFKLREATRSVEDKISDKQDEINALAERTAPQEEELSRLRGQLVEARREESPLAEIERLEDQISQKQQEIKENASTLDDALPLLIDMLDILLEPRTEAKDPETGETIMVPKETDENRNPVEGTEMVPKLVTAYESIHKALEKDEIGTSHIDALSKRLNEVAMEARPI